MDRYLTKVEVPWLPLRERPYGALTWSQGCPVAYLAAAGAVDGVLLGPNLETRSHLQRMSDGQ